MGQPNPAPPTTTPPAADPSGTTPPATPPADPAKPPATGDGAKPPATGDPAADAMATDAGKKALAELRQQNKALEQQLAALAPLGKLAEAMGVKPESGKTDVQTLTEQVAKMQKDLADEHALRLRAEVAATKKLPAELASRLRGTTLEELTTDADALIAAFPGAVAPGGTPGTPAPDPTQGARGGVQQLQTALAEAQKKGDAREAIRLKQIIAEAKKPK